MLRRALALFVTAVMSFTVISVVGAFVHAHTYADAGEAVIEEEASADDAESLVPEADAIEASGDTADLDEPIEMIDEIQEDLLTGIALEAVEGIAAFAGVTEEKGEADTLSGVSVNTDFAEPISEHHEKTATIETAKSDKAAQPMTVKVKSLSVDASKTAKKKLTIPAEKVFAIKHAKGEVTFSKKSGSKKITIEKNGKLIVAKGTKPGLYAIKVIVNAAGTAKYESGCITVTVQVEVT